MKCCGWKRLVVEVEKVLSNNELFSVHVGVAGLGKFDTIFRLLTTENAERQ